MVNNFLLKEEIKRLVGQGNKDFVIYPYGKNGKNINQMLINEFNLLPVLLVDNNLYKVNSNICEGKQLKERYKKDYYIILTIENEKVNHELYQQLEEFCFKSHIINIRDYQKIITYSLPNFKCFKLDRVVPRTIPKIKKEKIKIRVLNFSQATWNAIHTICLACESDLDIDLLIIMGKGNVSAIMCDVIENEKYEYVSITDYKVEEDRPDVLVISHPYDVFSEIKNCRQYCKLIVVASMQLVRYAHDWDSFIRTQINGFGRFYPDYYLFDSLLYNDMINAGFCMDNIIEMGNAKYDGIFCNMQKKEYPKEWNKLKGKKIILWTTDHGVHNGRITQDVTFDLYGHFLFKYANDNPNIGIIFRPHKTFIGELLETGLWSNEDVDELRRYCKVSENMVFDESLTYDTAFVLADGIITDAYCGITCSALSLLIPMCLLYRNEEDVPYHEEIDMCNYSARNQSEIESFIEIVINNRDIKIEQRKQVMKKCIKNFDGKNGERIKDLLKQLFWENR